MTLVAVLLQSAVYVASDLTFQFALLDVDGEQTIFSWLASSVIVVAAIACVLLAIAVSGGRRSMLLLAGLVAFLSLDEAIGIHEAIGVRGATLLDLPVPWDRAVWPALYVPLMLAVLTLLLTAVRTAPRNTSRFVRVGLGCLGAAVVSELISAPLATSAGPFLQTLEVVVEEGLELSGWGLIATGLLSWFGFQRSAARVRPSLVSRV